MEHGPGVRTTIPGTPSPRVDQQFTLLADFINDSFSAVADVVYIFGLEDDVSLKLYGDLMLKNNPHHLHLLFNVYIFEYLCSGTGSVHLLDLQLNPSLYNQANP